MTRTLTPQVLGNCRNELIRDQATRCLRDLIDLKASFDHDVPPDDIVSHVRAATAICGSLEDRPIVVNGHLLPRDDSPSV